MIHPSRRSQLFIIPKIIRVSGFSILFAPFCAFRESNFPTPSLEKNRASRGFACHRLCEIIVV